MTEQKGGAIMNDVEQKCDCLCKLSNRPIGPYCGCICHRPDDLLRQLKEKVK